MNPIPVLRLVLAFGIYLEASQLSAESVDLNIPVALDGFGLLKTPFSLEVESYSLTGGTAPDKGQERIKSATRVASAVLDAARQSSFERFATLSVPGMEDKTLQNQYAMFKAIMGKFPDLTMRRCFAVGTQLVFTAMFPSGRESAAVLLQCPEHGDCKQNLSVSFEPVPQTILYALKETSVPGGDSANLSTDFKYATKIKLFGERDTNWDVPVWIKSGNLYARGVPSNESVFEVTYGRKIQSVLDGYFDACESIGTTNFVPKQFSAESLTRIKHDLVSHKRPPEYARKDFVAPLSDHVLMLLVCPDGGNSVMIGFVSISGKDDMQVLNFAKPGILGGLLSLPSVKAQLDNHWNFLKKL